MGSKTISPEVPSTSDEPAPQRVGDDGEHRSSVPHSRRRNWIFLALLLLAGIVVYLPAIRAHYLLDDYLHASMIEGSFPAKRGPLELYDFINEADRPALAERGLLPWWSHPRLKVRFFRPLPSALRWADQKLFGRGPLVLHVHSVLWWIATVLAAHKLFQRLLPPRPAKIAIAIFALAPCHALPIAWLANREALVSLSLGLLAMDAYLRWREERATRDGVIALALFTLSMSGGEYAVCLGGYILAYELVTRGEGFASRFSGLLPFAAPAAAYLTVRARLGYGTEGSGFYSDPFREPLVFLREAPRRLVALLAQGWLSFDTEMLKSTTPWWVFVLLPAVCLALIVPPMRRVFAHLEEEQRATATWLLLGSFFAVAPVLAVVPSPRLLGASVFGMAAAIALLLDHAWFPDTPQPRRGIAELTSVAALTLGFTQLVHGPGTAWLIGAHHRRTSVDFSAQAAELRQRLGDLSHADVVVLRGMGGSFFMPFAIDPHGAPPLRWRMLAQSGHTLALRRDARTIDLHVPKGQGMFPAGAGNLFRDQSARIKAGSVYKLSGIRVTVLEVGPEGPRVVRCEADRELEAADIAWLTETAAGFPDAALPKPGFGQPFDP